MRTIVVYVHGLWLGGGESFLLRSRLARALGAECRTFSYPSVSAGLTENAVALGRSLRAIAATDTTLHLVAHSMGGLVILRLFELGLEATGPLAGLVRALPPGRVVLAGSPVRGSRSALRLARLPLGRAMLGRTAAEALLVRRERAWRGGRDIGVIAGDLGIGLGRVLGRVDGASDGTVWVDETDLPGATEQIRLHVSHSGMMFSPGLASQAAAFLRTGQFARS